MSNDFTDMEPDWNTYFNMGDEEREANKGLNKIYWRYNNGKITYERFINELDNLYFYPYLSDFMLKEIKNYNNEKKKISDSKKRTNSKTRQIKIKSKPNYLFIFILIVSILGFLIGVFGHK